MARTLRLGAAGLPLAALLGSALSLSGCAEVRPNVSFTAVGDADPEGEHAVIERARGDAEPPRGAVRVLVDALPEGLQVLAGKVEVLPGFEHRVIGKFEVLTSFYSGPFALFAFADYSTPWRRAYCYPQTVLNYATLFLWAFVVPLAIPCWGAPGMSKATAVAHARALAAAAGGDLVLLGYLGLNVSEDPDEVNGATGFILKADPRAAVPGVSTPLDKTRI
jgi:hypothetical protein